MSGSLNVIIAGGGLSGLALAQGLIKDGHSATVYERDVEFARKVGYYLHMNPDGGESLKRCLPEDLFELYMETSRKTYQRRESKVYTDQLHELSSQPHLGPPNDDPRPYTGVHRRTLRTIASARLGEAFQPGKTLTSYEETAAGVVAHFADGTSVEGDVLVGADGIRSVVRAQKLPHVGVVDTGIKGIGLYGRTPLTPELHAVLPPDLLEGINIAADRTGSRVLIGAMQFRQRPDLAAAAIAPDVPLERVDDYVMVSATLDEGTVVPPTAEWTAETPVMLRESMLRATDGWHPAIRALIEGIDLDSIFQIHFGFLVPPDPWTPSRVTLVGDAAHAMLPTLGLGANLALLDSRRLLEELSGAAAGDGDVVAAIGRAEAGMRDYAYPFMRMTMEHDRNFGGGALETADA